MSSLKSLPIILSALLLTSCGKAPAFNRSAVAAEGALRGTLGAESEGLSFEGTGLRAQVHWSLGPTVDELCSFVITFKGPEGTLVDPPFEIRVAPEMPDMGHGTSPVEIRRLAPGVWAVEEIFFSMPGRWVVPIAFFRDGRHAASTSFEVQL